VYLPKHFEQRDRGALIALMRARPLATLVVANDGGAPTADLIPLEFHPDGGPHGTLRGHVARANALWRHAGVQALAVFTGPESYVSPGWYPSKREHGMVVPTWNYTMVQARGRCVRWTTRHGCAPSSGDSPTTTRRRSPRRGR
jgi:transcriptional regulator